MRLITAGESIAKGTASPVLKGTMSVVFNSFATDKAHSISLKESLFFLTIDGEGSFRNLDSATKAVQLSY